MKAGLTVGASLLHVLEGIGRERKPQEGAERARAELKKVVADLKLLLDRARRATVVMLTNKRER